MNLSSEILVLALGVVLLLVHITLQSSIGTKERGRAWNAGARDETAPLRNPVAGRAERALKNYLETFPALVALSLALAVTQKTGGWGAIGAWLWFAGRVVYIPLYLAGIPYIRTAVWVASTTGLFIMLMVLLFG